MRDALENGRRLKRLTIVDDFTKGGSISRSITESQPLHDASARPGGMLLGIAKPGARRGRTSSGVPRDMSSEPMEPGCLIEQWQLDCELSGFSGALRQFVPAIRAVRFHKRKAWLRLSGRTLIIEIDRGAANLAATGSWPESVAILCRDLYVLTRCIPRKKGAVSIAFREGKLRVSTLGLKWMCPASLETPSASFISTANSTRLRPRKRKEFE
jgi:hypothetical protein